MSKRRTNDDTPPIWWEMAQVMKQYPFSRPTVYQWINSGLIESKLVPVTGAKVSITTVTRRIAGHLFRGCCRQRQHRPRFFGASRQHRRRQEHGQWLSGALS